MAILIRGLPTKLKATSCELNERGVVSHNRFFTNKEREIVKRLGFKEVYVSYDGEEYVLDNQSEE